MSGGLDVVCPAGEGLHTAISGQACRCRIAHDTITERENPHSLTAYCMNDAVPPGYHRCPIWRRAREEDQQGTGKQLQKDINRTAHDLPKAPVAM